MLRRLGTALGLLALGAVSVLRLTSPPAVVPATAPDTVFSAERAMRHAEEIAQRPRPAGVPEHNRVRDYIAGQLTAMGLRSQIQRTTGIGTRYQVAGRVDNVLAWLPGSDPSGKGVLLMAHYDGVGAGPAAADDGAGCAALLETLRALRARKTPLAHDVFVLFSDGEETGLLGAAAFVREHPWAKDVAMVLNFEARGTHGRSLMFETGPGNLDAARVLRAAGNATATSVFTAVYRALPNDTDLSELQALGLPALNFAFTGGVELYHTSRDDLAHLDSGSVQHHGSQMLALAKLIGNGPLPRPQTGDAVFFDAPLIGLVVYPEGWALPLALLSLLLVAVVVVRSRATESSGVRGVAVGFAAAIIAVILAGMFGKVAGSLARGPALWSGVDAAAIASFALALTFVCQTIAKRWSSAAALHAGAMIVWAVLAVVVSIKVPAASYLVTWPLIFAAIAALLPRGRVAGEWIAAAVVLLLLTGLVYGASAILLGLAGPGAIIVAVFTSLIAGLLVPHTERVFGGGAWNGVACCAVVAVALAIVGMATVRVGVEHPIGSALIYAEDADSSDAWLGTSMRLDNAWIRAAVGAATPAPAWTTRLAENGNRFAGRRVERVAVGAPAALLLRDTVIAGARRVVFRVTAPPGTTDLIMRATGARVLTSSIDGRLVDTTRYRYRTPEWVMKYSAISDSGALVALSIPTGARVGLELAAWRPGIPAVPGVRIPARPPEVVALQAGDASVVYKRFIF